MITAVLLAAAAALAPLPRRACAAGPLRPCAPAPLAAVQMDSLLVAAQRAARAWRRHDFAALFTAEGEVRLQLPGSEPTGPLGAAQAAELLRAFAGGATEESAEVAVVRRVDPDRARLWAGRAARTASLLPALARSPARTCDSGQTRRVCS